MKEMRRKSRRSLAQTGAAAVFMSSRYREGCGAGECWCLRPSSGGGRPEHTERLQVRVHKQIRNRAAERVGSSQDKMFKTKFYKHAHELFHRFVVKTGERSRFWKRESVKLTGWIIFLLPVSFFTGDDQCILISKFGFSTEYWSLSFLLLFPEAPLAAAPALF